MGQEKARLQGVGRSELDRYSMKNLTASQLSNMAGNAICPQVANQQIPLRPCSKLFKHRSMLEVNRLSF